MYEHVGRYVFLVAGIMMGSIAHANDRHALVSAVVITSDQYPVSGVSNAENTTLSFKVLNLDAVADIEQGLGKNLPADETKALVLVKQRIAQIGQSQLNAELREAYQALSVAMAYGLDRYPAIIFDQQAVVYGITDLQIATKKYRQWLKEKQEVATDE